MEAAHTLAQATETDRSHDSERTCLVTGESRPKDELIRFVVGPNNVVVPDLAQNLPGRGMWLTANANVLHTALNKNVFSRAAKQSVTLPADLLSQISSLLRKRCLDFLGLSRRAGVAVLGQPQVEAALKDRSLDLICMAQDASQSLDSRHTVVTYNFFTRDELGSCFGYDHIVYAGLKSHSLTDKLKAELLRLTKVASIISSGPRQEQTYP